MNMEEMAREYVRLLALKGSASLEYIAGIKEKHGTFFVQQLTEKAIRIILNS